MLNVHVLVNVMTKLLIVNAMKNFKTINLFPYQDEMYRLQTLHDKALKDAKLDLNAQLESLTNELDTKWSERLR